MQYSQIKEANLIVQKDMDKIKSALKGHKIQLILFGSYSKGEGGFRDGKPINDYDLLLLADDPVEVIDIINGLDLETKADVQWMTKDLLKNLKCTQQWYEIAETGKAIVGNMPKLPEWEPYDIPYSDGLSSLEKRATSMILAKYEMLKGNDCDWDKVMTQIGKMIIALGDIILIKRGSFSPSYRTRALLLGRDPISAMYTTAVSHKLLGVPDLSKDKLWELWNMTRNYYLNYVTDNKLRLPIGEAMLAIDETTSIELLKEVLIKLGSEGWLE